jgi:hypothetical protein
MIKPAFQPHHADDLHDHRQSNMGFANIQTNIGLSPMPMMFKTRNRADSQMNFQHEQFASPNNGQVTEQNLDMMLGGPDHPYVASRVRFTANNPLPENEHEDF